MYIWKISKSATFIPELDVTEIKNFYDRFIPWDTVVTTFGDVNLIYSLASSFADWLNKLEYGDLC